MVNLDAALFHHFLDLPIAYWIRHVPADAPEDDLTFKMAALELYHRAIPPDPFPAIIPPGPRQEQFATEPEKELDFKIPIQVEARSWKAAVRSPPHQTLRSSLAAQRLAKADARESRVNVRVQG